MLNVVRVLLLLGVASVALPGLAAEVSKEQIKGLDEQVQDIKTDVLAISTELNLLEEKLLFPSNTQVSLFISLSADDDFQLDAAEIEVDGKSVAHHIYSFKEQEALRDGGLQRIYTGNVRNGEHLIKVGFKGKSALGNKFTEVADYTFSKGVGPGFVEIKLIESAIGSNGIEFSDR